MNAKFKAFLKTGRGKLILSLGGLVLVWIVLLWQFAGSFAGLLPGTAQIDRTEREVKDLRRQNAALLARVKEADSLKARYRKQLEGYWSEERDGVADTELRNKIQQAAREAELTLNSLGSVRTTRINNELYYAEIDLSTTGSLEAITAFLARIQKIRPALSWRRLDMRLEPMRGRPDSTGSGVTTAQNLNFNGAIRVIGVGGEKAAEQGGGKK